MSVAAGGSVLGLLTLFELNIVFVQFSTKNGETDTLPKTIKTNGISCGKNNICCLSNSSVYNSWL